MAETQQMNSNDCTVVLAPWDIRGFKWTEEQLQEIAMFKALKSERIESNKREAAFEKEEKTKRWGFCRAYAKRTGRMMDFGKLNDVLEKKIPARDEEEEAFAEEIFQMREKFLASERDRIQSREDAFKRVIFHEGIEAARRQAVPAYTFEKLRNLPKELQLKIWSMACRFNDPKCYCFLQDSWPGRGYPKNPDISSRLWYDVSGIYDPLVRNLLSLCQDSRTVALTIFKQLRATYWQGCETRIGWQFFNVSYDSFYIGGNTWEQFRILVHILIGFHTTQSFPEGVQKDLQAYKSIRHLIVDLDIFEAIPPRVWTHFTNLETFTIAFYAGYDSIDYESHGGDGHLVNRRIFVKPKIGSPYAKRVDWVLEHAQPQLTAAKQEYAQGWEMPHVEAVVRVTYRVEVTWNDEDDEPGELDAFYTVDENGELHAIPDDAWYDIARSKEVYNVSPTLIQKLKARYLPSEAEH